MCGRERGLRTKKVHWALVGLGDITRKRVGLAIVSQPDSSLHACVTRDPTARKPELEAFHPTAVYADIEQMLKDPQVDAVYLATPVFLHAPQAIAAMEAGKDVLVEKPMALDAAQVRQMCQIARQTGRRLAVAYYRRFWRSFQLVKDTIESGKLGQIVLVSMALQDWYGPNADDPKAWRVRPELSGGGVIFDVGSHRLDLLSWWLGLPQRVVASVRTMTHAYKAEDAGAVLMEFAAGTQFTGSFHWNSKASCDQIHIIGTEGRLSLTPTDGEEVVLQLGRETQRLPAPKPANLHYPLIDDFARAVVGNRPPRFDGREGAKASIIMDAILRSEAQKQWVEIPADE